MTMQKKLNMSNTPVACSCGSSANDPVNKHRGTWIVTCSRIGCHALSQSTTKVKVIEQWNNNK